MGRGDQLWSLRLWVLLPLPALREWDECGLTRNQCDLTPPSQQSHRITAAVVACRTPLRPTQLPTATTSPLCHRCHLSVISEPEGLQHCVPSLYYRTDISFILPESTHLPRSRPVTLYTSTVLISLPLPSPPLPSYSYRHAH